MRKTLDLTTLSDFKVSLIRDDFYDTRFIGLDDNAVFKMRAEPASYDTDWSYVDKEGHLHNWEWDGEFYHLPSCVSIYDESFNTIKYYCTECDKEIFPQFKTNNHLIYLDCLSHEWPDDYKTGETIITKSPIEQLNNLEMIILSIDINMIDMCYKMSCVTIRRPQPDLR